MKNLIITLSVAIAIVAGVMIVDHASSSNSENVRMAKAVIDKDANGRIEQELILEHVGNEWCESIKKVTNYTDSSMETVTYKKEAGDWIAYERNIKEMDGTNVRTSTTYTKMSGEWIKTAEESNDNLSENADIVKDMVFDAHGNLVMLATYKWDEDGKSGLNKEEYEYSQGSMQKVTSYAWAGNTWKKEAISSLIER